MTDPIYSKIVQSNYIDKAVFDGKADNRYRVIQ